MRLERRSPRELAEYHYLELMKRCLSEGNFKWDRTGVGGELRRVSRDARLQIAMVRRHLIDADRLVGHIRTVSARVDKLSGARGAQPLLWRHAPHEHLPRPR